MSSKIPLSKELFPLVDNIPRLEVLYAKENFDINTTVDFWNKSIKAYCIHKRTFSFTIPDLVSFFTITNGAVPTSIKKSIQILESSDKVVKKETFNSNKTSNNGNSIFNVILQFSSMLISKKAKEEDDDDDNIVDNSVYICKSLLRNVEEKLFKYLDTYCIDEHDYCFYTEGTELESLTAALNENTNTLYLKNLIKRLAIYTKDTSMVSGSITPNVSPNPSNNSSMYDFNSVMLLESLASNDNDIKILCRHLQLRGAAVMTEDCRIIKFIKTGSTSNTTNIIINESDKARLELKKSILTVRKKISLMDIEIKECKQKAIRLKLNNDVNSALYECKIMKLKTDHNKKLYSSLCTLEMAVTNIEKVDMNRSMLEAYVIATKGLKAAKENLSIDTLEDAIDAFNDEMNDVQQYDDLIANSVGANEHDEELEKELEALMLDSTNATNIDLPTAPRTPIHSKTTTATKIPPFKEKALVM